MSRATHALRRDLRTTERPAIWARSHKRCREIASRGGGYAASALRISSHACSQRRHDSARTRQCSMCSPWRSHSSRQTRHATAQAWTVARAMPTSSAVSRLRTFPVVAHMSAQSRFRRMQRSSRARRRFPGRSGRSAPRSRGQRCSQSRCCSRFVRSACLWPAAPAPVDEAPSVDPLDVASMSREERDALKRRILAQHPHLVSELRGEDIEGSEA
jgi:hypothetical protein